MKKIKIKQCYFYPPNDVNGQAPTVNNFIFAKLDTFDPPWSNYDEYYDTPLYVSAGTLDLLYYYRSGEKYAFPMLAEHCNTDVNYSPIDQNILSSVARMIWSMYGEKWIKLFDTLVESYNPIENYRMTETESIETENEQSNAKHENLEREASKTTVDTGVIETDNTTTIRDNGTVTVDYDSEKSETGTDAFVLSESTDDSGTVTNEQSGNVTDAVYGFNSYMHSNSDYSENQNENTETRDLTKETSSTNTETKNLTTTLDDTTTETRQLAKTDVLDGSESRDITIIEDNTLEDTYNQTGTEESSTTQERTLTRYGNIGVTTSQQMIESERSLWQWNYFNVVFNDIDSVITTGNYSYDFEDLEVF